MIASWFRASTVVAMHDEPTLQHTVNRTYGEKTLDAILPDNPRNNCTVLFASLNSAGLATGLPPASPGQGT